MSRVDVVVPCHGYGRFLRECVASVTAQSGVDVRVLVIDDASPDDTAEIATDIAASDARVTFRRHAHNRGHIATYNEGLAWADGDYLLVLDADDVLTPGAFARATRLFEAHPEVALVYGGARITRDPARERFAVEPDSGARVVDGARWIADVCASGHNPVYQPTTLVRTRVQRVVGDFRPELPHIGDMEMWLRLAAHGSVGVLDAEQACYRLHASNMHRRYLGIGEIAQRRACFESFFAACGERVPDSDRLHALARLSVTRDALRRGVGHARHGEFAAARALLGFALADAGSLARIGGAWLRRRLTGPGAR